MKWVKEIWKIKSELNDNILAYINEHKMFGEYIIKRPFETGDCDVAYCFEVENEWADSNNGKAVYLYLSDIDGDQVDGKYTWDINVSALEFFYEKVLLDNQFEFKS